MSYPDQAPSRRPAAVGLAAAVLVLMAVGALAYAVAGLVALGGTVDRFRAAAAGTTAGSGEADGLVTLLRLAVVLSAVLTVLVGVVLVGLASGLFAGRPGARMATWVVCGLGLAVGCCGLAVLVGQRAVPLRLSGSDQATTAELLGLLDNAYPSWWIPVNAALSVGQVLGYLVVTALLALPAANAWFRRGRPAPIPTGPPPAVPPYPIR
ncbi:hypothetical protein OOK41_01725 [Micromonospora sp. NBC_01655]|uniref:hypothetical protein n=1 Tax=Micromonospora sp. NBC_01655 TaxID=2975983 RepID=UPI002254879D|nr:hypothetical protein [Micromonospora sp. NBC_01655]MCX4469044.1 hypothetical protein [Micromonospora sp. NBC_01655]